MSHKTIIIVAVVILISLAIVLSGLFSDKPADIDRIIAEDIQATEIQNKIIDQATSTPATSTPNQENND